MRRKCFRHCTTFLRERKFTCTSPPRGCPRSFLMITALRDLWVSAKSDILTLQEVVEYLLIMSICIISQLRPSKGPHARVHTFDRRAISSFVRFSREAGYRSRYRSSKQINQIGSFILNCIWLSIEILARRSLPFYTSPKISCLLFNKW